MFLFLPNPCFEVLGLKMMGDGAGPWQAVGMRLAPQELSCPLPLERTQLEATS